jgi:predicted DNA-binding protein (UPF0251 family)
MMLSPQGSPSKQVKSRAQSKKMLVDNYEHMLIISIQRSHSSMARPKQCRRVGIMPGSNYFKPKGIPLSVLEEVVLAMDEFEAIRLADLEGLYQEQAAERMKVSRQTFGRIIESAHRKIAEALVKGKALKVEGGEFEMASSRKFECYDCRHSWELPYGTGRPQECPSCRGGNFHRKDRGRGGGFGGGKGTCHRRTQQK